MLSRWDSTLASMRVWILAMACKQQAVLPYTEYRRFLISTTIGSHKSMERTPAPQVLQWVEHCVAWLLPEMPVLLWPS